MVDAASLRFVLALPEELSAELLTDSELEGLQRRGVNSGFALRITETHDLGGGFQRVCDAITPQVSPERLWFGAYERCRQQPERWQQIDRFPLREARNESCWFYPTHDGHYLSWRRELQMRLGPGRLAGPDSGTHGGKSPLAYKRDNIALLWSLLGDDTQLTCVGLTYDGRRIDWPMHPSQWAASAHWCAFSVESRRDPPLIVHSRQDVTAPARPAAPD
ncbi:MAG: hypothetical protein VKM34_11095 [Cyanobacteriota bacterium]|nr:hypothetical protein [Cyanobacteriota bacterium]